MKKILKQGLFVCLVLGFVFFSTLAGQSPFGLFELEAKAANDKSEFNGHYYQVFEDSMTWSEAKSKCEENDGYLVTITSAEEQSFVESILQEKNQNCYWLGATDSGSEGQWEWITGEPFNYTNWKKDEPNNESGEEDYLEIYLKTYKDIHPGQWNDITINGTDGDKKREFYSPDSIGYICEWNDEYAAGVSDLVFELNDDGESYSVKAQNDAIKGEVVIPDNYNGYPVTGLCDDAFSECENITTITIPHTVTSIGESAFYDCSSLTSISLSDNVTSIGEGAFEQCVNLTSVTIPDSVKTMGDDVFHSCIRLETVELSDNITSLGEGSFALCESLTSITLPENLTKIGLGAFGYCKNLGSIIIPDGVESINAGAFVGCASMESVTIPNSVLSIGNEAFADCGIKNTYYIGTEEDWNKIEIAELNDPIYNNVIFSEDSVIAEPDYKNEEITRFDGNKLYIIILVVAIVTIFGFVVITGIVIGIILGIRTRKRKNNR